MLRQYQRYVRGPLLFLILGHAQCELEHYRKQSSGGVSQQEKLPIRGIRAITGLKA